MTTLLAAKTPIRRRLKSGQPYWLISPELLLIAIFIALQVVTVFIYSLFVYNPSKPYYNAFAGLGNFVTIFTNDPQFWSSLLVTGKWVVVEVGLQFVFGLALAVLLNRVFRGRGLARAIAFAPWAISGVLATQIWLLIYNPATGISSALKPFGIITDFAPLVGVDSAFWSAILAELWRGIPLFAILLLADMQSIPKDVYEAAEVDGANPWRQFVYITLPYLREAIVLTTLLRSVWEFNNVDLLYTLTGGGPAGATTTLPLYVVQEAVGNRDFGYGSALTVVGFVVLFLFSLIYLRIGRGSLKDRS
jgi:multiple sugar transport system permease protein